MQCAICGEPLPADLRLCKPCAAARAERNARFVGVHGWLRLFCYMVGVLFPIGTVLNFSEYRRAILGSALQSSTLTVVEIFYVALFGLLVIAAVIVALSIAYLKPWAPQITRMFLVSVPVATASLLLVPFALSLHITKAQQWQAMILKSLLESALSCLICLLYFGISRRVRVNFPSERN
jgi:hypothetical protein